MTLSTLKTAAVVVPMHNRKELTADEQISFNHLVHYLDRYDKYLIVPDSLDVSLPNCMIKRFDNQLFWKCRGIYEIDDDRALLSGIQRLQVHSYLSS